MLVEILHQAICIYHRSDCIYYQKIKLIHRYVQEDWSVDNMKKIGFTGYVSDFSVDYDAIAAGDTLDIHKYLMKKNNIV